MLNEVTRMVPVRSWSGDLQCGAVIGDYVIEAVIAKGGCGTVYRATHLTLGLRVALKVLHANLSTMPKMVDRFVREVSVVNVLRHPNIVEIHEMGGLATGEPFYAMELLEGRALDAILRTRGRFEPEAALEALEQVGAALDAAHAEGVVHRDVKASNIFVVDGDRPIYKLLDFGIAKLLMPDGDATGLTTRGRQIGTPSIMAPEQLTGGTVDARVDVYALGVLLFRLLTGRLPFEGRSPCELARQHIEDPVPRPSERAAISPALDAVVIRCMEKSPDRRYQSVRSFLEAMREAMGRPHRRRTFAGLASAEAIGVFVELRLPAERATLDEVMGDDIGYVLNLTEEALIRGGFALASATGNEVLAVRPLGPDPAGDRRAALDVARSLHASLRTRPTHDGRLGVLICVHVAEVLVRARDVDAPYAPLSAAEILGGPLVCPEIWAPREELPWPAATLAAIEGLPELGGAGPWVRIRGPASLVIA